MTMPLHVTRLVWCLLLLAGEPVWTQAGEVSVNAAGQIETRGSDVRVFRGDATISLFGSVTQDAGLARFAPALPLVAGESYRIEFQQSDGSRSIQRLRFELPQAETPAVSIAPTPTVLPANALKLYLHFTQPMEQGVFMERITLHRQDGSPVPGAFRETELWSPDGKRLTLWLHPGRQKTGVNLNADEGPVLIEGQTHTLKISAAWRSTQGIAIGKEVSFTVLAAAPDHACPDPRRWGIAKPKIGTRDALRIIFDEALDPAMLVSALSVQEGAKKITGVVQVADDAGAWSFVPVEKWRTGAHGVIIDPLLEDLAGNNLQQPFEVDRDHPQPLRTLPVLSFEPGS